MNYYDISNEISRLVEENHVWSSTILLPDGDRCIDISSAAMGTASVTPANATKQPDVYLKGRPASVYRFDPDIYGENFWMQLKSTLTQVGCVSGCRLVLTGFHPVWTSTLCYSIKNNFLSVQHLYIIYSLTFFLP
jgi:hypothetical protein